jgi:hypothetical protein
LARRKKNHLVWISICIVIQLIFFTAGCVRAEAENPAPGFRKSFGMGGCFGKTALLEVAVEPAVDCLLVEGDNCNGGVLDIHNSCAEDLFLANAIVPAGKYTTFDLVEEQDGSYSLIKIDSNFTEFIPDADTALSFTGNLGDQEVEISFIKTAPLCE